MRCPYGEIIISRRTANSAIVEDAIARLLRRRKNGIVALIVAGILAIGSAVWSHYQAPPEARVVDGKTVRVRRVIDGDTIVIHSDTLGGDERVRLRGIDAPELPHDGLPLMHFGEESRRYLTSRLEGNDVILKFDSTELRDRYGRLLAFVYLGNSDCINLDLVRDGMAYVDHRFKNFMQSDLAQAETTARLKQVGLWKNLTTDQMPPWRQSWLEKWGRERGN